MSRCRMTRSLAVVFPILLLATACAKQPENIVHVMEISLSTEEKGHALDVAAALLTDASLPEGDRQRYPNIYTTEERGVFISLLRDNQAALTAFAWDDSIAAAIKNASRILKRLAVNEDLSAVRLRLDVVRQTTDEMTRNLYQRWGTTNLYLYQQGMILRTRPLLAVLADEMESYGLIDESGDFSKNQMKKFLKARGLGRQLRDQLIDQQAEEDNKIKPVVELQYVRFSTLSFMRDREGRVVDLWRNDIIDDRRSAPTAENIERALATAAAYVKECVQSDGRFNYIYSPVEHKSEKYNDRRHAAMIYAILEWMEAAGSRDLLPQAQQTLAWLVDHSRPPAPGDRQAYDWRAVEFFVRQGDERRRQMKTGATGLALAAFARYTSLTGDRQFLPLMRQYGEFLDFMMMEDGGVYTDYFGGERHRDKGSTESYYAGEAVFGLVSLFEVDPDPRWLELALRGVDYLTAPANIRNQEDDNWLVYALEKLSALNPAAMSPTQREYLRGAAALLRRQFNETAKPPDLSGSFGEPERVTTADSTRRLEVAGALYRLGEQWSDAAGLASLRSLFEKGLPFLLRNQYNDVNTMFFSHPEAARGGFIYSYRNPVVHLEAMQSAISVLLEARRMAAKN